VSLFHRNYLTANQISISETGIRDNGWKPD